MNLLDITRKFTYQGNNSKITEHSNFMVWFKLSECIVVIPRSGIFMTYVVTNIYVSCISVAHVKANLEVD